MDKNIASAMLLRLNKQDQIEALKSIGFTTVNENTPASDIAKYMQWSGTLLDLSLATLRIESVTEGKRRKIHSGSTGT
jgi:hypothetical protein